MIIITIYLIILILYYDLLIFIVDKKRLPDYNDLLLEAASKRGYFKMSRSLLKSGIRCSRIVVRNSCIGGNTELIHYLYHDNAPIDLDSLIETENLTTM